MTITALRVLPREDRVTRLYAPPPIEATHETWTQPVPQPGPEHPGLALLKALGDAAAAVVQFAALIIAMGFIVLGFMALPL